MEIFLTPASISFITQAILFLGISIYLVLINTHTKANYWLCGFYTVLVASSLAGFMGVSSLSWYNFNIHLHDVLILVALTLLAQFAYNFPEAKPALMRQATIVLTISIVVSVAALLSLIPIFSGVELFANYSTAMHYIIEALQILLLMWITYLFLCTTVRYSQNGSSSLKTSFLQPTSRVAKAARGFSLGMIALLLIYILCLLLRLFALLSLELFIFALGNLWVLTIFIITLINHTPRSAAFLVKFIGLTMLTVFTGISAAAWLAAPVNQANYLASYSIPDRQTIHFEQSNATYTITQDEFSLDSEFGKRLTFQNGATHTGINTPTSFPFAGQNWTSMIIDQRGYITFSADGFTATELSLPEPPQPIIAALFLEDHEITRGTSVYASLTDEKSVITWFFASPQDTPDKSISTQLTLFPDGSFDISYNGIRSIFKYSPYLPKDLQQISGYFLGNTDQFPSRIQFNSLLPFTSQTWSGVYQDFYIDFRSFLHQTMTMHLFALLLVTVVTTVIFPIFFQNSLWTPLHMLRQAIQQVLQGNYQPHLEPRYSDDMGQTILEFKHMLSLLEKKQIENTARQQELSEKLTGRSHELKTSVERLAKEIEKRKNLSDALDKSLALQKKYHITDEMTGIFNRAHLVEICEKEIRRAKRYGSALSFVLMDPDYLRMINETYGFVTGDEVLKALTQLVGTKLRETDILGRIGGEEFAILMPQTNGKDALKAANRIRNIIGSESMLTSKGPVRISASFGVTEMPAEGIFSVDVFFQRANLALEHAKNHGRNSAVLWSPKLESKIKKFQSDSAGK